MTRLLRLLAFAIAIAGVVDPAITLSGAVARARRHRRAPACGVRGRCAIRDRLARDLSSSYEIVPTVTSDAAAAIVIGDRYPDQPLPDSLLVATVTTAGPRRAGVRIVRVEAPREVPPATVIHLDAELEARVSPDRRPT